MDPVGQTSFHKDPSFRPRLLRFETPCFKWEVLVGSSGLDPSIALHGIAVGYRILCFSSCTPQLQAQQLRSSRERVPRRSRHDLGH